jgi:hypothetical protein
VGWRKFSEAGRAVVTVDGCLKSFGVSRRSRLFLATAANEAAARDEPMEIDLCGLKEISSYGLRALPAPSTRRGGSW